MKSATRFAFVLVGALVIAASNGSASAQANRPNIIFILMDDLRFDELGCVGHPFVKTPNIDRLAKEGAIFRNAFATTPLCSPSRSCFLTGLYAHATGIIDNVDRSPQSHALVTWPRLLHDAGYQTAFIGKWHMGVDASPRPGFDHWVAVPGQGKYINPELNIDGKPTSAEGYVTDLFNKHAVAFVKQQHAAPFCLFLAHKCVHPDLEQRADGTLSDPNAATFLPAERHKQMYAADTPPRRPNAFQPPRDKPALTRKIDDLPPLSPETATDDETIRNRLRLLMAAEEGVGQILNALQETGQLDNTLICFTSDHGYFYGEHCLSVERRLAYEEAIRIPLLIRYPPLIKPGTTFDQIVLSIDLAPTLLELGAAQLTAKLHGRSFLPLLQSLSRRERVAADRQPGEGLQNVSTEYQSRTSFLIEHFSDNVFPRMRNMGYQAVRTNRWKYIHYRELPDSDELYDLHADPYEMINRIHEPALKSTIADLQTELRRLLESSP